MLIKLRELRRIVAEESKRLRESAGEWQAFVDSVDTLREACSAAIAAGTGVAPKYLQALRNIEADLHELRAELE